MYIATIYMNSQLLTIDFSLIPIRLVHEDFLKLMGQKLVKISNVDLIIGRRYPIIDIKTGTRVYYYLHSQVGDYSYWVKRLM